MKQILSVLFAAVCGATIAASATAQPAELGQEPSARPIDCTTMKDKGRCEALNKSIVACRYKVDDAWRQCMRLTLPVAKFVPPKLRDCTKAHNKELCEANNSALSACASLNTRAELRKCMAAQLPMAISNRS